MMVGYAYAHRVLHRLVLRATRTSSFAFMNRALRPVLLGVLDRWSAATCSSRSSSGSAKFAAASASLFVAVDLRQHRHVVRALRDHRHVAAPRLPARRAGATSCPTLVDVVTLIGSFGLFFTCFLLFCRFLPVIAMAEVKAVLHHGNGRGGHA